MPVKSSIRKKTNRASRRDLDIKIQFLEGLVRRDPDYVTRCNCWATTTRNMAATSMASRWMNISRDSNRAARWSFYNLACSCSLTGQFDRAASALETALQLGYRDFRWLARTPTFTSSASNPFTATSRPKSAG